MYVCIERVRVRVRVRVGLMYYGWLVMSRERNVPRLGAATIMGGCWFQAIIVRGKKENL